jgi:hypothetical protein
MLYDYSYCLNRALWDSYFIASTGQQVTQAILINPRQKAFTGTDDTTAIQNAVHSFQYAAENIAIHGAFNVNSTSQNAWTAFLGSTAGNFSENETYAEYSRIQTLNNTTDVGLCQLLPKQVQSLATEVVKQIKLRGVAGSIGEFVNRKLIAKGSDPNNLGLKGALQAAIDGANINSSSGGATMTSNRKKDWFDDEAASGPFWACKPGYLTQADILQSTATTLCARGDTFCIYAYGNALDASGKIEAETRCEAIVQRLPELIDPSNPDLGRKYKILAMKWITLPPLAINLQSNNLYDKYFGHITDTFKRSEAIRSIGDKAWSQGWFDQYWAIPNMAYYVNNVLQDFINNPNLSSLLSNLNYHLQDKEWQYSQRFNDPVTGAFNAATWKTYEALRDLVQGSASKADVQQAINNAYSEIDAFISNSSSNQQEFQDAINFLDATAASAGDINNKTPYTQAYQGDARTGGAQAAGSIIGLSRIEELLSHINL